MDKAIEIKRRAQRCIQNGDLDGAVSEYTKLVAIEDSDPYNFVLLADLLFKKGDTVEAGQRYLAAAAAYEKAGLYKNAIAVCKKLLRLQLAPVQVYQRLASAHALDGLSTEGSLYYLQHAEYLVRDKKYANAVESLQLAFETSNENVKALERLAEVQVLLHQKDKAVEALLAAAQEYGRGGLLQDAERCRKRAKQLNPAVVLPDVPADEPNAGPPPGQPRRLVLPTAGAPREAPARAEAAGDAPPKLKTDSAAPEAPAHPRAPRLEIETTSRAKGTAGADRGPRPSELADDLVPTGATISHTESPLEVTRSLDPSGVAETDAANAGEAHAPAAPEHPEAEAPESVAGDAPQRAATPPRAPKSVPKSGPPRIEPAAAPPDDFPLKPARLEIGALGDDLASEDSANPSDPADDRVAAEAFGETDESASADDSDVRHEPIELSDEEPAPRATAPRAAAPRAAAQPPGLSFQPAPSGGQVPSLNDVERMLSRAQECFRAGQREAASEALAGAARAYDALGRYDSAATIYRSLGKSAHATSEVLQMWIENCERRSDNTEAAQVACELGDRALNEGKTAEARTWFERARDLDGGNEVSLRRLQRLGAPTAARKSAPAEASSVAAPGRPARPAVPAPRAPEPPPAGDEPEGGRVEVAVGRGEAVTFDLGSLINEFQRGVDTQLSGDAQGHYDLAMSYREMGLLEQAVESFRVAARDPALGLRAMEMIGRCYTDQGRFDEAIEEFERALNDESLDPEARLGLQYEIGAAHQAAGRLNEALAAFEGVHAQQPDFPNVDSKIRALRKSMGRS